MRVTMSGGERLLEKKVLLGPPGTRVYLEVWGLSRCLAGLEGGMGLQKGGAHESLTTHRRGVKRADGIMTIKRKKRNPATSQNRRSGQKGGRSKRGGPQQAASVPRSRRASSKEGKGNQKSSKKGHIIIPRGMHDLRRHSRGTKSY